MVVKKKKEKKKNGYVDSEFILSIFLWCLKTTVSSPGVGKNETINDSNWDTRWGHMITGAAEFSWWVFHIQVPFLPELLDLQNWNWDEDINLRANKGDREGKAIGERVVKPDLKPSGRCSSFFV